MRTRAATSTPLGVATNHVDADQGEGEEADLDGSPRAADARLLRCPLLQ
ncbi:MAG: hypothetical protein AB1486_20860 [Planctomycetota bacterium]